MKSIKYFDEKSGKWIVLAANNASVLITQTPKLIKDGETYITIDEAFNRLTDKYDELRGNIAWLAKFGGGGSGSSSGGSSTTATIKVVDSLGKDVINGSNVFSSEKNFNFNYVINQPVGSGTYYVTVYWDGQIIVNEKATSSKTYNPVTIQVDKFSSSNIHTLRITAYDNNDLTLEDYISNVTESSISLSARSNKVEVNLDADDTVITLNVSNKAVNSTTTLHAIAQGNTYDFDLGTSDGSTKIQEISIYNKMFAKKDLIVGNTYRITFQVSNSMGISSAVIPVDIVVKNTKTLLLLVDGISMDSDAEPTQVIKNSSIIFSVSPYISNSNYVYAAYQVLVNGTVVKTVGDHFSDATVTNYIQNIVLDQGISKAFYIDTSGVEFSTGSQIKIVFRAWAGSDFSIMKEITMKAIIAESNNKLFSDQDLNYFYARWCHKSSSEKIDFPLNTVSYWDSVRQFSNGVSSKEITERLELKQCNGIVAGFIQNENKQNVIRLFNNGYGQIKFNPFSYDLADSNIGNHWQTGDFTLSLTFKSDNHPNPKNTIFFCGDYTNDKTFQSGIKVDLNTIYWYYQDENSTGTAHRVTASLEQNVINTVDFVCKYDTAAITPSGTVYIYVNGICSAADTFKGQPFMISSCEPLLGSGLYNGDITDQCDVDFYDIKFIKKALSPQSVVINYMNDYANANSTVNGADYVWYKNKSIANIFKEDSSGNVSSILYNGDWANIDFTSLTTALHQAGSNIPVLMLTMDDGSIFTEDQYVKPADKTSRLYNEWSQATGQYYDPTADKIVNFTQGNNGTIGVKIQGTSTLTYRSKNLEIKLLGQGYTLSNKTVVQTEGQEVLFQPKKSWLPENEFTLKADNIDSAHANNASIGNWINFSGLLADTPPMQYLKDNFPKDSADIVEGNEIKVHDEAGVKHTLEGFPCIVLMKFASSKDVKFLGIYSFNLGRAAYYNMGFKFLKDYTHKKWNGAMFIADSIDQYPFVVNTYSDNTVDVLSDKVIQSKTFSYEFGDNSNTSVDSDTRIYNNTPVGMFWQGDKSIVKNLGEFKYNGITKDDSAVSDESVWDNLSSLFEITASMIAQGKELFYSDGVTSMGVIGVPKYGYDPIKGFYILYEKTSSKTDAAGNPIYAPLFYPATSNWSSYVKTLENKININNAFGYYIVCQIFGLVDSLGKNMTLRTWDGGKTWWTAFYDMDTANGESNTGYETVLETAYVHRYFNQTKDDNHKLNTLAIQYNDPNNGFDQYSSRLWDILESTYFTKEQTSATQDTYKSIWDKIRNQKSTILTADGLTEINKSCIDNYVNSFFKVQLDTCGEMIFNYDYAVKYLVKYNKQSGLIDNAAGEYSNIRFLHGNRVNYVRNWLNNRWKFLDGVFEYDGTTSPQPYNTHFNLLARGNAKEVTLLVRTSTPFIFTYNQGNSGTKYKYFIPKDEDTEITLPQFFASNTTCTFNGPDIITKLDKLSIQGLGLEGFGTTGTALPLLEELDLSNDVYLNNNPIEFRTLFFVDDKSYMRKINLSGAKWGSTNSKEFTVDVSNYNKLISIDISNSDVQSLTLPKSSLQKLSIFNSRINALDLVNQIYLQTIDFTKCTQLASIRISNCSSLTELALNSMENLKIASITKNEGISNFTITDCNQLEQVAIESNDGLKNLFINKCYNSSLSLTLNNNINLESLNISDTAFSKPFILSGDVTKITNVNFAKTFFDSIQFNTEDIATYNNEKILDLSRFTSLQKFDVSNMINLVYLKSKNIETEPVDISSSVFVNCKKLKRIFGCYNIKQGASFSTLSSFSIREERLVNGVTPLEPSTFIPSSTTNAGLVTNFKLEATNINDMFYGTNTGLTDIYYILGMCDNVTSMANTFMWSKAVTLTIENSFNRQAFAHCGNVVNASQVFLDKFSGQSILYTPKHVTGSNNIVEYTGTLSPLKNCTNISNMFRGTCKWYTDECLFRELGLNSPIKWSPSDFNMNLYFIANASDNTYLSNQIDTYSPDAIINGTYSHSGNPSTKYIVNNAYDLLKSFEGKTSLDSLLNQQSICLNFETEIIDNLEVTKVFKLFPNLVSITNSFNTIYAKGKIINPWYTNTGTLTTVYNVGNFISSSPIVSYMDNNLFLKTPKLVTYNQAFINRQAPEIPYQIFKSCKSTITDITAMFENLSITDTQEQPLPGDMFKGCTALSNIERIFRQVNFKFHLTSKGFLDCKLSNVNKAFAQIENIYTDTSKFENRQGEIPYGLFMMLENRNFTPSYKGLTEEEFQALNLDVKTTNALELKDHTLLLNQVFRHSISSMQYTLSGSENIAKAYHMDLTTYENVSNLIVNNENYNPVKYIKNPKWTVAGTEPFLIENTEYNPYLRMWNKYYYDGFTNPQVIKDNITKYSLSLDNMAPIDASSFFVTELVHNTTTNSEANFYCVASDLFRYCTSNADITGALSNNGSGNTNGIKGLTGRIPKFIFESLYNTTVLRSVFNYCRSITPYDYGEGDEMGIMFHQDMFTYLPKLNTLDSVFAHMVIPNGIKLHPDMFITNTNLTTISGLFFECSFGDATRYQIPDNLFRFNFSLTNITNLFAQSSIQNINFVNLINKSSHPNLSNVSGFMQGCTLALGTIPIFWLINAAARTTVFTGVSKTKILNEQDYVSSNGVNFYTLYCSDMAS